MKFTHQQERKIEQIELSNQQSEALLTSTIRKQLSPLIKIAEVAKPALADYIIGICSSLAASLLLAMPKLLIKISERFAFSFSSRMGNTANYEIGCFLLSLCSLVLAGFEIIGAADHLDFSR